MVLTLKVVWISDSGDSEIRRLTVHDDVCNRYSLLSEKIVKLFPDLVGRSFQLGWKDSEGDFIVMSSDEELAQAIANAVDNGMMKIFVTTKTLKNDGKPKASSVHPNVVCDGCNGSVCGYRYKCLECLDYDLCEACHVEDKHPGHDMIKFTTPVGQESPHHWTFPGWRRMYQSMFGHRPFGKRCGGRKYQPGQKQEEATNKKEKSGSSATSPHAEFLKNIGKSVAFFLDPLGIDVDVMVSEGENDSPASNENGKKAEAPTEVEEKEPKNMSESLEKTTADFRRHLAEYLEVDKNARTTFADLNLATSASLADLNLATSAALADLNLATSTSTPDVNVSTSTPLKEKEQTAPQNEDSPLESSTQGARPKNYGLFQRTEYTSETTVDANKDSRDSSPENFSGHEDWTVVNNVPCMKDGKGDTQVESTATEVKVSYPELPEEKMPSDIGIPKEMPHPDPKIANALSKMCAMGFTNEGGWLTRLLETKSGNINDVLDALYPNRH